MKKTNLDTCMIYMKLNLFFDLIYPSVEKLNFKYHDQVISLDCTLSNPNELVKTKEDFLNFVKHRFLSLIEKYDVKNENFTFTFDRAIVTREFEKEEEYLLNYFSQILKQFNWLNSASIEIHEDTIIVLKINQSKAMSHRDYGFNEARVQFLIEENIKETDFFELQKVLDEHFIVIKNRPLFELSRGSFCGRYKRRIQ